MQSELKADIRFHPGSNSSPSIVLVTREIQTLKSRTDHVLKVLEPHPRDHATKLTIWVPAPCHGRLMPDCRRKVVSCSVDPTEQSL
jgi:hypothetical protein